MCHTPSKKPYLYSKKPCHLSKEERGGRSKDLREWYQIVREYPAYATLRTLQHTAMLCNNTAAHIATHTATHTIRHMTHSTLCSTLQHSATCTATHIATNTTTHTIWHMPHSTHCSTLHHTLQHTLHHTLQHTLHHTLHRHRQTRHTDIPIPSAIA